MAARRSDSIGADAVAAFELAGAPGAMAGTPATGAAGGALPPSANVGAGSMAGMAEARDAAAAVCAV